jgi:hypothetical protein
MACNTEEHYHVANEHSRSYKITYIHTKGRNTLVFTFISHMQFTHSLLNKTRMQTNIQIS